MAKYFLLIITIPLIFSCSSDKKKAVNHYIKAKEFYQIDDVKNASREIELAIKLDSSNLDFQLIKAEILNSIDKHDLAISILKKLVTENFKLDTVYFNLASSYYSFGLYFLMKQNSEEQSDYYYKESLIYYNKAIDINSNYYKAYIEKQRVLHNLNKHDDALIVLNTAMSLFPDSLSLICYRGIEKFFIGDHKGAVNDLNNSIESGKLDSSDTSEAYRFKGMLNQDKGYLDEAIVDLTNALKFDYKNEFALVNRASCYQEKGLKDKACEDYRRAADLGFVSIYPIIKSYCND
jgi:tetratricopeptide (TPR) repeat protein